MTDALRLMVDARDLASDTRGIGRYARAILRRLVKRDDIELSLLVRGPWPLRHRPKLRASLGSSRFKLVTQAKGCDVIWHPANGTFFRGEAHSIATIHDAVPFRFPHPDPNLREQEQAPFLRSVESASRVIAVSCFDRDELVDVFDLAPARIEVIYHGIDPFFCPAGAERNEPYFLFVGDPFEEPRKNFILLHKAYRKAFTGTAAPKLVVVGSTNPQLPDVRYAGLAREDAQGAGDEHLRALYRGAMALCLPSYYETFGMPMIEAMVCGTPVIASHASCLPEIGGDAALYAPPHDVNGWSEALQRMAGDGELRATLREKGLDRVRAFSWERSARLHAELFHACAK